MVTKSSLFILVFFLSLASCDTKIKSTSSILYKQQLINQLTQYKENISEIDRIILLTQVKNQNFVSMDHSVYEYYFFEKENIIYKHCKKNGEFDENMLPTGIITEIESDQLELQKLPSLSQRIENCINLINSIDFNKVIVPNLDNQQPTPINASNESITVTITTNLQTFSCASENSIIADDEVNYNSFKIEIFDELNVDDYCNTDFIYIDYP